MQGNPWREAHADKGNTRTVSPATSPAVRRRQEDTYITGDPVRSADTKDMKNFSEENAPSWAMSKAGHTIPIANFYQTESDEKDDTSEDNRKLIHFRQHGG